MLKDWVYLISFPKIKCMRSNVLKTLILLTVTLIFFNSNSFSQTGSYIAPTTIVQLTSTPNYNDLNDYNNTGKVVFENTIKIAYGLNYIYNGTANFGFQTGFKISNEGQNYSGKLEYDVNENDSTPFNYTSSVNLRYYEVPFLLRFNSSFEDYVVNMAISAGLQLDFLAKASFSTLPAPLILPENYLDIKELFRNTNIKFIAETSFSFLLSDNWMINTGLQWTRSLMDIENKDFKFDKTKHIAEYYFPVSTKKDVRTDISNRYKTTSMTFGLMLGVSYWFNKP